MQLFLEYKGGRDYSQMSFFQQLIGFPFFSVNLYYWSSPSQALCTQCFMDKPSDFCCRLMFQPHWRLSWHCKTSPSLIPTAKCSGNGIKTPNIPQDDSQAHPWGLICQLLHSLCLANTFFPVEILPNRLKGDFPSFFFFHSITQSKNWSVMVEIAKADLRHPPSPPFHPQHLPCSTGKLGIRPRAPLWKAQPEGRRENPCSASSLSWSTGSPSQGRCGSVGGGGRTGLAPSTLSGAAGKSWSETRTFTGNLPPKIGVVLLHLPLNSGYKPGIQTLEADSEELWGMHQKSPYGFAKSSVQKLGKFSRALRS